MVVTCKFNPALSIHSHLGKFGQGCKYSSGPRARGEVRRGKFSPFFRLPLQLATCPPVQPPKVSQRVDRYFSLLLSLSEAFRLSLCCFFLFFFPWGIPPPLEFLQTLFLWKLHPKENENFSLKKILSGYFFAYPIIA